MSCEQLADTIDYQLREPSLPPRWEYFSDDDWKIVATALRAYAPHVDRICELLRFNNEFEERARVAERENKLLRAALSATVVYRSTSDGEDWHYHDKPLAPHDAARTEPGFVEQVLCIGSE